MTIERILVRSTNWIGDAVMTTPALRRLRSSFPAARITLLATPRTAGLFAGSPLLDEVIEYRRGEDGVRAFVAAVRTLRERRFDLALLFQNAFEAALLARLGGVRWRIGYAAQGRSPLLTHQLERGPAHVNRHQTQDYLDLVALSERVCFGPTFQSDCDPTAPELSADAAQINAAASLLNRHLDQQLNNHQLNDDSAYSRYQPLVMLNVGATNSRAKCWPAERFAALADRFAAELDARIVLIGAPSERENAARVMAQMRCAAAINLAGETTMAELVGLLAQCDLVVSNDTGPAHIAAALGRPTLTVFGPTNEFETAPTGPRAAVIRADGIECARCMHRVCPIDHRCMTRLSADDVFARAVALLATSE